PTRSGCRLDPRLRLRALYGRRALLHRRHGNGEIPRPRQAPRQEIRQGVQGAEAAYRHGGEGRDLLRALRSVQGGYEEGGLSFPLPLEGRVDNRRKRLDGWDRSRPRPAAMTPPRSA